MKTKIINFQIEYMQNPIGLDTEFPHYSWEFITEKQDVYQSEYRIVIKGFIDETVWDSGIVKSDKTFGILHGGAPLKPDTPYRAELYAKLGEEKLYFKSEFRTGLMNDTFRDAKWICADSDCSSPLFRKTFFSEKRIAYATLYVAARGFYEPYINGKRIGNRILAPSMLSTMSYRYDCGADAYDVSEFLTRDNNTIGIWLGRGYQVRNFNQWGWLYEGGEKLWCALSIVYEDLSTELILSDESWIWHRSPITENSIYNGEVYDKNLEINNWCSPYIDVSDWKNCRISPDTEGVINLCTMPVVKKRVDQCQHFEVFEGEETVCDFGVNGAGFVRIKVTGEPGTRVIIDHAENINPDGTINTFTNRSAKAQDIYILKGHEIEVYEPRFTYHCFRYARIRMEGVAQLISAQKITIGTDFIPTGSFKCNDNMIERMYDNAMRSIESNLLAYPSDCAVRDERTPCLMDSFAYEEFALRNFDIHSYYRLWMKNCKEQIDPNGNHPVWIGDVINLPLLLERYFADGDIVEEMYPYMKKAVQKCIDTYEKNGFDKTFGDWCPPHQETFMNPYNQCAGTPAETGLCAFIWQLREMSKLSSRFNDADLSEEYSRLEDYYRSELYRRFFDDKEGCFSGGKQTPNLMSIACGAAKEEDVPRIYEALKKHIREVDNSHLDTGIMGTRYLIDVLSRDSEGMDILYDILHKTDYPSFGQQIIEYDATCLCEQWFGLVGMMTCDHPMFAGIFADYSKIFAGITDAGDCFKNIKIAPKLPRGINELSCTYRCVRGEIGVYIRHIAGVLHMDVVIPPNCSAEVITPDGRNLKLKNGKYML